MIDSRQQIHEEVEAADVELDELGDLRILDLQRHLATVMQAGAMHLR